MLTEMLPELPGRLLDELVREDGLIGDGEYYKELIDWPRNERDGYVSGGVSLVPNCLRVMALEAMAELTGRSAYLQQAAELKQVIRSKMFKNGRFTDSPETEHTAQHSLFFPVVSHVAAAGEVPELADIDIRCSVYAVQFLLESLYMAGYGQRALQLMLSDGQRSWSNMLRCGTTITLESWDPELKPNIDWNHAWGSAPANIIPRCLCGVRPVKAGFREFEFDPQPGGLTGFHSVHPTPHGSIEVEYDNGSFKVKMPENCAAVYAGKRWTKEFSGKLN